MSHEPMHRIIRLKRYEQPPEGYHENFLKEFHRRQRAELLKPSISTLLTERISAIFSDLRVPAFAYAGAAALAILAGVVIMRLTPTSQAPGVYSVSYSTYPVTIQKMQPVSLRVEPANQLPKLPSQLFPPSFLLQARPASHESPLSF